MYCITATQVGFDNILRDVLIQILFPEIVFSSKINDFHFESSLSHEEKFAIAVVISFSTKKNRL